MGDGAGPSAKTLEHKEQNRVKLASRYLLVFIVTFVKD
jgi:hypothetical protein